VAIHLMNSIASRVVTTVIDTAIVIGMYKLFLRITLFTN